ncbi:unnamed protein product, partial [Durusdinium trenchii]
GDDTENPKDGADTDAGAGGGGGDGDDPGDEDTEGKSIWRWLGPSLGILFCGGLVGVWWLRGREKVEEYKHTHAVQVGGSAGVVDGEERGLLEDFLASGGTQEDFDAISSEERVKVAEGLVKSMASDLQGKYEGISTADPQLEDVPGGAVRAMRDLTFLQMARSELFDRIAARGSVEGGDQELPEKYKQMGHAIDAVVVAQQTKIMEAMPKMDKKQKGALMSAVQRAAEGGEGGGP